MSGVDRGIDLNVGQHGSMQTDLAGGQAGSSQRQAADQGDRDAFQRALRAPLEGFAAPPEAPAPGPASGLPARGGATAQDGARRVLGECLERELAASARSLMVSQEGSGREVCIELDEGVLPGVSMRVFESEGALTAVFVCVEDEPRERLNDLAQPMAQALAESLGRSTLIQVRTDDDDDPRLVEAWGEARG